MNPHAEQMADLLEHYLMELEANPNAAPPRGLDPQMIQAVQKLNAYFDAPEPSPEFVTSLRGTLDREAARLAQAQNTQTRRAFALPRWSFVGIGAALVLALGGFLVLAARPAPVSAEQVLNQARSVANNLAATGVNTFELESESEQIILGDAVQPIAGMSHTVTSMAYAGPTRWRVQGTTTALGDTRQTLNVSDGSTLWTYDASNNIVQANIATGEGFPLPNVGSLQALQQDASNCYTPQVVGEQAIAGRAAYKVELGENKCPAASVPTFNGTRTLWVDKETFFVLRDDFISADGKQNFSSYLVTRVRYNIELPGDLFQYTPPPGAQLEDNRPKPAPSLTEFQNQVAELARGADYPLFVPSALPQGLVPRAPRFQPQESLLKLEYVPPEEASSDTLADSNGVTIQQVRAGYDTVRNWTTGAAPVEIDGAQGWLRDGGPGSQLNTGVNSAVMLLRDGTFLSISSFALTVNELMEIARSLEPVPGGHAPLPNPTPPALADLRAQADYPILIPTYVPEGLTPEPPTPQQIQYHRADGTIGLIVQNASKGEGGMERDPRYNGTLVTLPNGATVHQLGFEPEIIILWWNQDNGYSSLEGHGIGEDEMLKIANSMSSTAELGETENPLPLPTPTPLPAPSFTVLRPGYLPEKMTVTETKVAAPTGQGAGVELRFDPRPDGAPHDVMTLTQYPIEFAETGVDDPQAITQAIGGRTVTVIKRGQGCVSYYWTQGNVALTLTNPYDPPGEPGQVRFPCKQMEQVIASIQ